MKKEIIIVIIIIITIVTLHIYSQNYTKKSIGVMYGKLDEIENIAKQLDETGEGNKEELYKKIDDMQNEWSSINRKMALYIEHDELEKVNSSIILMKGYIQMEDYSQGIPELENCEYILYHIQDKQSLKITNLF